MPRFTLYAANRRARGEDRLRQAQRLASNATLADGTSATNGSTGQYRVRHHLQRGAKSPPKHHIVIDAHEPVKDTGLRRTYPNMLSREGARGQEFNAWGRPDQSARAR